AAGSPESSARSTAPAAVHVPPAAGPGHPPAAAAPNRSGPAAPPDPHPGRPSSPLLLPNRSPRLRRALDTPAPLRNPAIHHAPHAPAPAERKHSSAATPSRRTTALPYARVRRPDRPPVRPRPAHAPAASAPRGDSPLPSAATPSGRACRPNAPPAAAHAS